MVKCLMGLHCKGECTRVWSSLSPVFNHWDSGSSAVCDPQQHKQFLPHCSQVCDSCNHILARYKLLILSCEDLENTMTRMCRSSTSECMWYSVSNYAITVSKGTWSLMANTTTRGSHTTTTCVPFLSSLVKAKVKSLEIIKRLTTQSKSKQKTETRMSQKRKYKWPELYKNTLASVSTKNKNENHNLSFYTKTKKNVSIW